MMTKLKKIVLYSMLVAKVFFLILCIVLAVISLYYSEFLNACVLFMIFISTIINSTPNDCKFTMSMLGRLLCKLGRHKWKTVWKSMMSTPSGKIILELYNCEKCSKQKSNYGRLR